MEGECHIGGRHTQQDAGWSSKRWDSQRIPGGVGLCRVEVGGNPGRPYPWRLPQSSRRPGRGPWSRKGSITERFYLATALGWLTHGNMVFPQPGLLKFFFSFSKESLFCILIILKCLIINCQGNCNNTDNYMEEKPRKFYHFVTFWRPSFHESLHIYTSTHRGL